MTSCFCFIWEDCFIGGTILEKLQLASHLITGFMLWSLLLKGLQFMHRYSAEYLDKVKDIAWLW